MRYYRRLLLAPILLGLLALPMRARGAETFENKEAGVKGTLPGGWTVSEKETAWQKLPAMTVMLPLQKADPYQGRVIFVFETINWVTPMTDAEYIQRCRDRFGVFENKPRFDEAKPCKLGPLEALVHHTTSAHLGIRVELTRWMKRFGDQAVQITFIDDSNDAKTTAPLVDKFLQSLDFSARVGIEEDLAKKDEASRSLLIGTWTRPDRRGGQDVTAKRTFHKDGSCTHDDGLNPALQGTWQLVRGIIYVRFTKSNTPTRFDVLSPDEKTLEVKEVLYEKPRQYGKM